MTTPPPPAPPEADWLDDLLARHADGAGLADDGFSDAVLHRVPPPQTRRAAGTVMLWVNRCALVVATGLVVAGLPQAVDLLLAAGTPGPVPPDTLEHTLPSLGLLGWLAWWSWRQASLSD